VIGVRSGQPGKRVRLPGEVKDISLFRSFHNGYGSTEDSLPGGKAGGT